MKNRLKLTGGQKKYFVFCCLIIILLMFGEFSSDGNAAGADYWDYFLSIIIKVLMVGLTGAVILAFVENKFLQKINKYLKYLITYTLRIVLIVVIISSFVTAVNIKKPLRKKAINLRKFIIALGGYKKLIKRNIYELSYEELKKLENDVYIDKNMKGMKTFLKKNSIEFSHLSDKEITVLHDKIQKERFYKKGRYNCPDSINLEVKTMFPHGKCRFKPRQCMYPMLEFTSFNEKKPFAYCIITNYRGGRISCRYKGKTSEIYLTARIPDKHKNCAAKGKDDRLKVICAKVSFKCPDSYIHISDIKDKFDMKWWSTLVQVRAKKGWYDTSNRELKCLYTTSKLSFVSNEAQRYRTCKIKGQGFDCI